MVKEIERAGIPVVHMCTVTPISLTVGANRIIPTIAIPHPLGDPSLPHDEEKALRRKLVEKALKALTTEVEDQTVLRTDFPAYPAIPRGAAAPRGMISKPLRGT